MVGEVKYRGLPQNPNADPDVYFPLSQRPVRDLNLAVRSGVDPDSLASSVRGVLQKLDPDLPAYGVTTMAQAVAGRTAQSRFSAWLLGVFGALALALAAIGIYSVMAYAVEQRSREIGVRVALGARAGDVLKMVVGQGMRLALAGVALGVAASFALTRMMETLLFNVSVTDPLTFAGVVIVLGATNRIETTNREGTYTFREVAPGTYAIRVLRVGYRPATDTVTVADGGTATADFAMAAAPVQLDEIVTTAVGEQRKLEVGNAVTTIDAGKIAETAPITEFSNLLSGRAAGVQVLKSSGTFPSAGYCSFHTFSTRAFSTAWSSS